MKISYECGPCFLRQAREALDLSTDDESLKMEIMGDIFKYLSNNFKENTNSNSTGSTIHKMIINKTGCRDPYFREKIEANNIALKYLEDVKKILRENGSLENYVKIAIVGNILDFGSFTLDDDVESIIKSSLKKDLTVKDIDEFEYALKKHSKVLYLVDNTGEIVFDKLLLSKIKEYNIDITIAVKSQPILNDACLSEALKVGLDEFGEIVEIGCGTVGYVDSEISEEFREIFQNHEFIISKGMGNYEGLTEIDLSNKDVFFLLCAKCNTISRDIGVNLHDMLLFKKWKNMIIGFIGFGKVAVNLVNLFTSPNFKFITSKENRSFKTIQNIEKSNVEVCDTFKEVALKSDILILPTSPSNAVEVAKKYGKYCKGIYLDLNNISPYTTFEIDKYVEKLVDGAIIGKIDSKNPVLYISGKYADDLLFLDKYIKTVKISDDIGDASMLKLLRSTYTKTLSALLIESVELAKKHNLLEEFFTTLQLSEGDNFREASTSRIKNTISNSKRKSEELTEIIDYFGDDLVMVKAALKKLRQY